LAVELANLDLRSGRELRRWVGERFGEEVAEELALRLPEFVAMREAVREVFEASVGGGPFPAAAAERLNEASARVPVVRRLRADGAAEEPIAAGVGARVLAAVARSAIDVAANQVSERLRLCPACGRFFLATRSDRVWCSGACGNRVRVARHHARRRAGPAL
jgi:predicted RNA-binding Zn ribbon-like protein